jgi:hypothetical protein
MRSGCDMPPDFIAESDGVTRRVPAGKNSSRQR